jgi:competence protein ComEC
MVFLLVLGLWRGQAFYFAVILIWVYIILIGFPVSGIRAAIMGIIALLAQKLGRQNTSSRVLIIAASLMLLQNPLLLFYDVSFQLSFLASLGIIHLKPLIDNFFMFIKEKFSHKAELNIAVKFLLDIVSITLSAQIITLPIIVYNFNKISLIAPITNILVLPIIPSLTILGFLVSIIGVFSNILGFLVSLPCLFLLSYLVKVLDVFYQPWAVKTVQNISWIWIVVYYLILTSFIWYLNKFKKPKFLGY